MGAVLSLGNWVTSLTCQSLTLLFTCANCCTGGGSSTLLTSPAATKSIYVVVLGLTSLLAFFLRSLGSKLNIKFSAWKVHCVDAQRVHEDVGAEVADWLTSTRHLMFWEEEERGLGMEEARTVDVYCQGDAAVYRLSFVLSLFFLGIGILASLNDRINRGFWGIKFIVIILMVFISFFIPNSVFDNTGFAWVARIGSVFFLLLQILILIEFAYDWGERWISLAFPDDGSEHDKKYVFAILGVSLALYLAPVVGIPIVFSYYSDCSVGLLFSVSTLLLILLLTGLTFGRHKLIPIFSSYFTEEDDEISGEILPAAVISAYVMYLLWSALDSNPDPECAPSASGDEKTIDDVDVDAFHKVKLFIGVGFAVVSLMYTSYTTSSSVGTLLMTGSDDGVDELGADGQAGMSEPLVSQSQQPVYNYQSLSDGNLKDTADYDDEDSAGGRGGLKVFLFHLTLMSASMYMAMLLTNWGVNGYNLDQNISVSEANMWVKIISQWITVVLYIWTLFAPAILTERDFG